MNIKPLRTIILFTIILIVISEVISWIYGLLGGVGGLVGALVVAAVFIYCGKMAKAGTRYSVWILVPTIIFTIIPATAKVWSFFADTETSTVKLLWQYGPYFFRFVLPVALLLYVYVKLGKHPEKI